jgi:hypothetical protein
VSFHPCPWGAATAENWPIAWHHPLGATSEGKTTGTGWLLRKHHSSMKIDFSLLSQRNFEFTIQIEMLSCGFWYLIASTMSSIR